jgi:hypothetical protein
MEVAVQVLGRDRVEGPELNRIVRAHATETTAVALAELIGTAGLSMIGVSDVGS